MQAGPAYGERKPLSHLVMDSSKSTNWSRVISQDSNRLTIRVPTGVLFLKKILNEGR